MLTHIPESFTFVLAGTVFCKPIFSPHRWSHPGVKLFVGEETEKHVKEGKLQMGKTEQTLQAFMVSCCLLWCLRKTSLFHLVLTYPSSFFFESEHWNKNVVSGKAWWAQGTPAEKRREKPPFDSCFFLFTVYPVSVFSTDQEHPEVFLLLYFAVNLSGKNLQSPYGIGLIFIVLWESKLHNLVPLCSSSSYVLVLMAKWWST